ncbi:MAG: hypothetical protein K2K53_02295, partial [Oscillospiraceae bacterium]|nr:hypothetical protein [Oscillospiraceae bacterium]
ADIPLHLRKALGIVLRDGDMDHGVPLLPLESFHCPAPRPQLSRQFDSFLQVIIFHRKLPVNSLLRGCGAQTPCRNLGRAFNTEEAKREIQKDRRILENVYPFGIA